MSELNLDSDQFRHTAPAQEILITSHLMASTTTSTEHAPTRQPAVTISKSVQFACNMDCFLTYDDSFKSYLPVLLEIRGLNRVNSFGSYSCLTAFDLRKTLSGVL